MSIKTAQNQLNKYLAKGQEIRFEEENDIKQTEKQIAKKTQIEDNYFERFIKASSKLTEEQFYSLENVYDLESSYEEILKEAEYLN
jgi:hypothetical protein